MPDTCDQPESYCPPSIRDSVFSNDVFWRLLGKYLNFGDLKDCRFVSRQFNQKVLEETNFKSRALLNLNAERLSPNVFGSTTVKWKNIRIICFALKIEEPSVDLEWLYSHLSEVETLFVSAEITFEEAVHFLPRLNHLLEACKSLKKLSIDQQFLSQTDVSVHMPSSSNVQKIMENLPELELTASTGRPLNNLTFPCKFGEWMDVLAIELKNLNVLRTDGVVPEDPEVPDEVDEDLHLKVQNLLAIIVANQQRFTSLQLEDMQLWSTSADPSLHSLCKLFFPRLQSVKIRVCQIEARNIVLFTKLQPMLTDFDITILNEFPVELMKAILEKKHLKRLTIKTKSFDRFTSESWKMGELPNLEEFALNLLPTNRFTSPNDDIFSSVLMNLPKAIKVVRLRGLPNNEKDPIDGAVTPAAFFNLNPTFLTELCISRCGGRIDDEALEFIFNTFRLLRILNISNTDHKCTDYGFTGLPLKPDCTPFSISNLLGLKHLTLRSCGAIGDATMIHGIKFKELCYLDVSNNLRVTEKGCRAVLAQNPSLEILKTSEMEFESEEELKKLFPRLKEHQFSDGGDSDDEDASENHHHLGSDSDISGGGYPGYPDQDDDFFEADEDFLDYDDDYDSDANDFDFTV